MYELTGPDNPWWGFSFKNQCFQYLYKQYKNENDYVV